MKNCSLLIYFSLLRRKHIKPITFSYVYLLNLQTKVVKLINISNIIPYICTIQSRYNMKLNRIKAVLAEKGISQTWLAKQLGKSFSMVNAYACNRIQPNLETLQQIAVILQVDLKDLITDKGER